MYLIPATTSDAPVIHDLAERIWWKHYPAIIGEEQVRYMLARMYALPTLEKQISEGLQQFFIVKNETHPIGFIAFELKEDGTGFIHKFYILNTQQRKGLGAEAFRLLKQAFPDVTCIRLQVNRQNYQAINFYFKMGFVIELVADFDIGDGYFMNDFIMRWMK
jgi:ribosomal protein S18 acetylase RimI-like enzyme